MSEISFSPLISPTAASRWAPTFDRLTPPETLDDATSRSVESALFADFAPRFDAIFAETPLESAFDAGSFASSSVAFDRFGFATRERLAASPDAVAFPDDAARTPVSVESISFEVDSSAVSVGKGARFLVVAPTATFRLIFAAALGFDVRRTLRDGASARDFDLEARRPTTPLERAAFRSEYARFARFAPSPTLRSDASDRRPGDNGDNGGGAAKFERRTAISTPLEVATGVDVRFLADDVLFYWERRRFELAARTFYWTFAFPASVLSPAVRAASNVLPTAVRAASNASPSVARPAPNASPSAPRADARIVAASTNKTEVARPNLERPEPSRSEVELTVEITRGELSLAEWRALRPGSVLPLGVPANGRFIASLNGVPKFLARPGLRRGVPAVLLERSVSPDFFDSSSRAPSANETSNRKK